MKEFNYTFVTGRGRIFEVNYYTLGSNRYPHFTTSAAEFNRPRTDFNQCGQAQERLLTGKAMAFYKEFDKYHLSDLSQSQYDCITAGIEELKQAYPFYIEADASFNQQVELEREYRTKKGKSLLDENNKVIMTEEGMRTEAGEDRLAELLKKHDADGYAGLSRDEQIEYDKLMKQE